MGPTALARVAIAQSTITSKNSASYPSKINPSLHFLVDRKTTESLLKNHENCRRDGLSSDENDDEQDKDGSCMDTHPSSCLVKPGNRNPLLANALTNSNGSTWRRQRPLIQRAFANRQARKVAKEVALETALRLLATEQRNNVVVLDARELGLKVAVQAMSAAVFGKEYGAELISPVLLQVFDSSLVVKGGDAVALESLGRCVACLVDRMAAKQQSNTTTTDSCLVHSLLRLEGTSEHSPPTLCEDKEGPIAPPYLTRQEVVSNCHSALLAGTQSIATTLAASLLYCAEHPAKGGEMSSSTMLHNGKAVCHETLRILPPVATLPRCPVKNQQVTLAVSSKNTDTSNNNMHKAKIIKDNEHILIDVLAMAHVVYPADGDNDMYNNTFNTWNFCPAVNGARTSTATTAAAAPWGLGDRRCPAGALSVDAIAAVLDGLAASSSWELSHPNSDCVGPSGQAGWVSRLAYARTLLFPDPVEVTFSLRKDEDIKEERRTRQSHKIDDR